MANLAIKGHKIRGKEVIEILEMLGGKINGKLLGTEAFCDYYIDSDGSIDYKHYSRFDDAIQFTLEQFFEKFPYKVGDKVSSKHLKNYEVSKMEWESVNNRVIYKLQGMGWYSADELQPYKEETMKKIIKIDIPKGYEFAGVDDDKQQIVFEKIGCQYPKTYEECCVVLGTDCENLCLGYAEDLLDKLQSLLICRDAYWQIAGEELGLNRPWEPDYDSGVNKYGIICMNGVVQESNPTTNRERHLNKVLDFPTPEMRDAFYENFKELIESVKEFL